MKQRFISVAIYTKPVDTILTQFSHIVILTTYFLKVSFISVFFYKLYYLPDKVFSCNFILFGGYRLTVGILFGDLIFFTTGRAMLSSFTFFPSCWFNSIWKFSNWTCNRSHCKVQVQVLNTMHKTNKTIYVLRKLYKSNPWTSMCATESVSSFKICDWMLQDFTFNFCYKIWQVQRLYWGIFQMVTDSH